MTPAEHYKEAERLMKEAHDTYAGILENVNADSCHPGDGSARKK